LKIHTAKDSDFLPLIRGREDLSEWREQGRDALLERPGGGGSGSHERLWTEVVASKRRRHG
jgi:hypothetical protein